MGELLIQLPTGLRTNSIKNYDARWDRNDHKLMREAEPSTPGFLRKLRQDRRQIIQKLNKTEDPIERKTLIKEQKQLFPRNDAKFDSNAYDSIRDLYHLYGADDEIVGSFYQEQLIRANKVVEYIISRYLPQWRTILDTSNSVSYPSKSPSENLSLMSAGNAKLTLEESRMHLLADIAAKLVIRRDLEDHPEVLKKLDQMMEAELYADEKYGENRLLTVYAAHDNATNKVKYLESGHYEPPQQPEDSHLKMHNFQVRTIEYLDEETEELKTVPVMTNKRVKNTSAAIIKALRAGVHKLEDREATLKAGKDPDHIDPLADVKDAMGLMYVTFGGQKESDMVMARVAGILERKYGENVSIVEDNKTNGYAGQSESFQFKRLMIQVKNGASVPVEVFFYTAEQFINAENEVGAWGRDKRGNAAYTGQAHELYELQRLIDVADYIWPPSIYKIPTPPTEENPNGGTTSVRKELLKKVHETADKLKKKGRSEPVLY